MRFLKFKHAIHDAYEFASVVFAQEFEHMHEALVMQAAAFFFELVARIGQRNRDGAGIALATPAHDKALLLKRLQRLRNRARRRMGARGEHTGAHNLAARFYYGKHHERIDLAARDARRQRRRRAALAHALHRFKHFVAQRFQRFAHINPFRNSNRLVSKYLASKQYRT